MEIAIRNYVTGSYLLENDRELWDAIVILDSGLRETRFIEQQTRESLILRFDDVSSPVFGKRPPAVEDISLALKFATKSDRLMVCCRAGQSRSAALAFSIAYQNVGQAAAAELLNPRRHAPNSLVIELAAVVIGDPMFSTAYRDWRTTNSHIRMIDYIDEIEEELNALEAAGAKNLIVDR